MKNLEQPIINAIRSLYQLIMLVDGDSMDCRILDYNKEFRNISSTVDSFDDFSESVYCNVHPEDRDEFDHFIDPSYFPKELSTKVYSSFECRIRQGDQKYYWSELIFCHANEEDSTAGNDYLFLIRDIHARKMRELAEEAEQRKLLSNVRAEVDELFEENMKDEQTGCYNRKGLKYYTDKVLKEARDKGLYVFVCVADLNGLKYLNDNFGHHAGDEAIAAVSKALLDAAPKGTRIVRTGGDEFLMFAATDKDSEEPKAMEGEIDESLRIYNEEHPNPFTIGASYGWVLMPVKEDMIDLDDYIEMADEKMYEMKKQRDEHRRS